MDQDKIKHIIEALLLAAGRPLSLDQLVEAFGGAVEAPEKSELRAAIEALRTDYEGRGIMITEVASGFRTQIRPSMTDWVSRLWEERPPRYSRALLETLALIAYRQPITRGEIEEIRGVSVSTNIVRTLMERHWVRVVGHRDVPGKPAMYGTTREFLDYFGLKKLDDLPPLSELKDLESLGVELELPLSEDEARTEEAGESPVEADASAQASHDDQPASESGPVPEAAGEDGRPTEAGSSLRDNVVPLKQPG
jgi:segregation and condensation protein B